MPASAARAPRCCARAASITGRRAPSISIPRSAPIQSPSSAAGWSPSWAEPTDAAFMIELEKHVERAILVGAPSKRMSSEAATEHLEELARLADTAGAEIVGELIQRLD